MSPTKIIDTYEIIFMYEGTAWICEDGTEYILNKDDMLFLEPSKEHYGFRTSENFVSFSWIHFHTDCEKYKNLPKYFHISNSTALKALFSQCLHIVNTPIYDNVCADLYTALYIEEIIYGTKNFVSQNYLASQIKEYITLNTEKSICIKNIAKQFGYHENHISRVFKNAYGITLKKYIDCRKLEYSKTLLNTTLYPIGQISQMLSFKSENHFIKFFKYHTHITPSEYRNTFTATHVNKS